MNNGAPQLPKLEDRIRRLIALPSVSSPSPRFDQSNRAVVELLAEWLEPMGFQCEILPLQDQPEKANLIATLGSGPGGLVLSGHTDTVPFDDGKWHSDPFVLSERDNRLYGLGSSDMKGFFALAIEAASRYQASDFQQPLIILATADEESSMAGARELSAAGRPKARYAIVGEPTSLRPIRMHKGIMMDKVSVQGRTGHSSNPDAGHCALETMHVVMSDLMQFRAELQSQYQHDGFDIHKPTMNLGCLHAGDSPNRICNSSELHFDLRCLPGMNNSALREDITRRLAFIARERDVPIAYEALVEGCEPYEQAADSHLVKTCERLTGHTAGSVAFATEAPFLQGLGMETIVMGPGSIDQAHQPDEYMELQQINPCVTLLGQLIETYCLNSVT